MECPTLEGLSFDQRSREGIARIQRIEEFSQVLKMSIALGTLANIFAGSNAAEAAYNIYSTDWVALAEALNAIPALQRRLIFQEAALQMMDHANQRRQYLFWKAIMEGCRIK